MKKLQLAFNKSTRRNLLKTSSIALGSIAVGVHSCNSESINTQKKELKASESNELQLSMFGYKYDRVKELINGKVKIEGCSISFEPQGIGDLNTHVFNGPQTLDVTEIGLHSYMLAFANDNFRKYTLLLIFPMRVFRHKSVFIRTDRGINKPEDLKGKTIGTPGYSSTSLTWIRGIFQDEYGIKPEDVQWVTSNKDSGGKAAGKRSKQEMVLPDGIQIKQGTPGMDESDLLVSGEVDALFHALEPKAYVEGNPIVARLFPDYRTVEQGFNKKTGIFPIMHAVAVKKDLLEKEPWLAKAVFDAYVKAKNINFEFMKKMGWAMVSLPWFGQEMEETIAAMGEKFWPYWIEQNRKTLETLFRYSYEQGLSRRELTIEELFDPSSLDFKE